VIASLLLAAAVSVSFAKGQWNPDDFTLVKCARQDYIGSFVQLEDRIANRCPDGASAEEVFKKHNDKVYAAMLHKRKLSLGATVSSRMGWDWRMAPLVVIAREPGVSTDGKPELREHWEVVLFDEGINVWHHFYENGKQRWFKAASLALPKECRYQANVPYDLQVKVGRDSRKLKCMTVTCAGYQLHYVDESLPEEFYGGIIGCEGRNFFWDFRIEEGK